MKTIEKVEDIENLDGMRLSLFESYSADIVQNDSPETAYVILHETPYVVRGRKLEKEELNYFGIH